MTFKGENRNCATYWVKNLECKACQLLALAFHVTIPFVAIYQPTHFSRFFAISSMIEWIFLLNGHNVSMKERKEQKQNVKNEKILL